jgi:hypothetical protein
MKPHRWRLVLSGVVDDLENIKILLPVNEHTVVGGERYEIPSQQTDSRELADALLGSPCV